MMTTHVCLVSQQLPANLIPILMDRPGLVVLLISDDMQHQGERLHRLLSGSGVAVETRSGLPSSGIVGLRDYATEVATSLEGKPGPLILNATGGNKLMALAFVEVFRGLLDGIEVIYTDTDHGCIESLTDPEHPTRVMGNVLDIPTYLTAYGLRFRSAQSDDQSWRKQVDARKSLTKWLAGKARELESFFSTMNALAVNAMENAQGSGGFAARQLFKHVPAGPWREAMKHITDEKFGLVDWNGQTELIFRTEGAARFLGGGWLEEYAWHVIHDAAPYDVRANVVGTWEGGSRQSPGRNEFDLLAVHLNRMLVVECKTGILKAENKDAEVLYKLESLGRNAGGLFGKMWLVSLRSLGDEARSRASAQGITLFEGERISELRPAVLRWMEGAHQ